MPSPVFTLLPGAALRRSRSRSLRSPRGSAEQRDLPSVKGGGIHSRGAAAVRSLPQRGRVVGQRLNIKMCLNCSTDSNTAMVAALKNKASVTNLSNVCEHKSQPTLKKSCEDSEILMHRQLLQGRLCNLDTFWCHKMQPAVWSFAEKKEKRPVYFLLCVPSLVSATLSDLGRVLYPFKIPCLHKLWKDGGR